MAPDISIIIPVYNGAPYLAMCLQGVRDLRPAPLECIVVDDGSTDGSLQIAAAAGVTVISIPERRGPAYARNLGARRARGGILLFLDADVVPPRDALARVAACLAEDPTHDAVIGSYDVNPASPDLISQYRNLLHCYTHQSGQSLTCVFWTGCGAIRTAVFRAHGGFDEMRTRPWMEDVELGIRLRQSKSQIWLDKGLQVQHLKRLGFLEVIKTDLADRAIPWTMLILRSGQTPADLNLKWGQRFSVLASGWTALALISAILFAVASNAQMAAWLGVTAAGGGLAVAILNRGFYRFLAGLRSPWFAFCAFPLHVLYFLCGGAGLAVGLAAHCYARWTGRIPAREPTPQPVRVEAPGVAAESVASNR